jgi:branched-chain amino acid aminotransferase
MSIRVHVGGRIVPPDQAHISVFDRGFLYGDSVYETIATVNGRPFALTEHLDRLARSGERIGLPVPPRSALHDAIAATLTAAGNTESRIRVIVTRGQAGVEGSPDLDPASAVTPQLVVIVMPLSAPSPEMYERGVAVEIVSVTRNDARAIDPAVKSGNYLNNVLALGEARRRSGAYEAVLCAPGGGVAEGASSNIFAVVGGQVRTPALSVGILDGVTRGKVLALCRQHGLPCAEVEHLAPDEVRSAQEVFITSATRGVLPVTTVDRRPVGAGVPGPLTRRLMALYQALEREAPP